MKKRHIFILLLFSSLITLFLCSCGFSTKNENQSNLKGSTFQKVTHLRQIPAEIKFRNHTYRVISQGVINVGENIGNTDEGFQVYKLSTNNEKTKAFAIKVREKDPTIYYKIIFVK